MAGLKIEGNLDNISDKQLGYIKDVIEKRGFKDAKVVIEAVGQAGDNYVANVKRIIIQEKDGSTLKMIAKVAPNQEALREIANTKVLFRNEHLMYTKVLPKFEQVQRAADIPKEQRLRYAACYGSFEEAPHELVANALSVLESDAHKKIVKDVITLTLTTFAKILRADRESKHLIIQQGDAWTNNIMFKFEEGNLLESIMIDYQVSKASNPVTDLQYMIFNCTDYKSRKEHFHDWIDYYHTELDKSLSSFGLKANYVYPKDQLDADLKRYGKISLGLSIVLSSMLILKPEDAKKMKEAMESADMNEMSKNTDIGRLGADSIALFKSRVEDSIQ
ncbi:Ecdysteroid 22-kinase [Operophtera brumata]|uniref:Ecdysteroid 22-kinase n=1 Tax=Operophtera brumata TaxID=104452 RepID=A0A0L7LNK2_OPEBR|nr:Ecdysteroid 22-kinase [Operophtera brumata]